MIIESILTSTDPAGVVNYAPMGVEWGEETIVIKPFLETTTFRNLKATRVAVVNLTDDVMLFARGATGDVTFPSGPAAVVRGPPLGTRAAALSTAASGARAMRPTPQPRCRPRA